MKVTPTSLPEVLLLEPVVFSDDRGFFLESWNERAFNELVGAEVHFVQDNHSRSTKGVLRGMHYQLTHSQGKLVRVTAGKVFDVVVDMRRSSPRLGMWEGTELSAENRRQLWIPPGFAHGFLVLSEAAECLYKATEYYNRADEHALAWDDPRVGIDWPLAQLEGAPILSARDAIAPQWPLAALFD